MRGCSPGSRVSTSCSSPTPTRSERPPVATQVGARALPSVDALLDAADAIVIAAATDAHADLVRAGIGRRVPTYCEKPLAGTLDETIAVAELVEASGVPFQLGFQRRFDAGLPRSPADGGERRAGHRLRGPAGRPRPGTAARVVHPGLGRPVPGLLGARLRCHPLAAGDRGRRGVRRWRRAWLPGLRQVRRRRHRRGHAAHGGRHPGGADQQPATTRWATTSGPSCSARGTASAWASVRAPRCARWNRVCRRQRVLRGRTSSPASRTRTARSWSRSSPWRGARPPPPAPPVTASSRCASRKPPPVDA